MRHLCPGFFFASEARATWEYWDRALTPEDTPAAAKRKAIAEAAAINKLEPFADISMVDSYAQAFGILPREAQLEPMDEVLPFFVLWLKRDEYQQRYDEERKRLDPPPAETKPPGYANPPGY